ncbi:MAG: hypothetical protein K2I90_11170, partial [Odoribacter sp.]|nr:hypothetical protein [Odoribacter sp.]
MGAWKKTAEYSLDFTPEAPPAAKPELKVEPIIAGCWSSEETFDLTRAIKSVSPSDATIVYYTDADATNSIDDPENVQKSTIENPNSPTEIKRYYAQAVDSEGEKSDIQEIEVTFYQKPEVSLALSNGENTVCYNNPITLQATNKNGFTPGQYQFARSYKSSASSSAPETLKTSAQDTCIRNATASATYYVYVTSGNQVGKCKDTATVEVTVNQVIAGSDVTVTGDKTTICNGESVELSVSVKGNEYSGTIAYAWSTGETTKNITVQPTENTTYDVRLTLNGCTSNTSVGSLVITVNPLPTFSRKNPEPVCSGVSTTVDITQSGTGNDYQYYSNEGLTNVVADPTKVAAGKYWVTLTKNGCTSLPQEVTATVNPSPEPKILVNGAVPATSLCTGTEITLTASGADGCSYAWSNVPTADEKKAQAKVTLKEGANNFGLTVTNTTNKCSGTASAVAITGLKLPSATIDKMDDVCANSEVTLGATPTWSTSAGAKGVWTKGGQELTTTTSDGKLVTTTQVPGGKNTYTLNLTDGNGCTATQSVDVTGKVLKLSALDVNPTSVKVGDPVTVQVSAKWTSASGANVSINGSAYDRVWKRIVADAETVLSGTDVNIVDRPNIDGTRYKVVAEKEGCRDSVTSNPVEVTTEPFEFPGKDPKNAIASVENRFNVCYGEDLSTNPVKWYVKVQGGSKEYTYNWKFPSSVTATAKDDTLTITAIDYENFGNNQLISVEISDGVKTLSADQAFSVRPIPQININGANGGAVLQACKGVNLTLTAAIQGGGGDSFEWATGQKGSVLGALTSAVGTTTYRVTVTYDKCSNTDSVKVQVNELPTVSLVAQVDGASVEAVCPGTEITLVGTVEGESSPTFKWMHGASSLEGAGAGVQPTIAVNSRTTYGVEYTDATTTCKAEASATVNVHPKVTLAIGADPGVQVCPGTQVTLTATKGDADTYVWTSSNTSEDMSAVKGATYAATPVSRTTYTVNGKDEHGCEANPGTTTLDVRSAPTLELAKNELNGCEGLSVDLRDAVKNLGTATLKVRNAAGELFDGRNPVTAAGTYTIYIDGGSCSSNEAIVEVQFHALPTVTLTASDEAVCLGKEITLTANGEGTELKYTPNQSWTNTPTSAGEAPYTVTVTDTYGCTATASTSVTVKPLPVVAITDPGTVCAGAEVTLQANGADTYAWTGFVTDGTGDTYKVTPSASMNTFTVTGTKDGCTAEAVSRTLTIQEAPKLEVARNLAPCVGESIDLKSVFDIPSSYTLDIFNKDKGAMNSVIAAVQLSDTLFYAKVTTSAAQGSCSSEDVPVRVAIKALPQLTISGLNAICRGAETVLTVEGNAASYAWAPAGKDGANSGATMTVN